ncbi:hypothetical protein [Klebsiella pneumoniae]|uniref:hypothetical protein n=1 Tax=Klebsiella pneumoniae TaxID=573 RepID=UPI0021D3760F|nr:hypothetical protein [Klebsiella pneumoniae]MCU6593498.1 hypothetical protein [Klebsiella pneumoniae]
MDKNIYFERQCNLRDKYILALIAIGILCFVVCIFGFYCLSVFFSSSKNVPGVAVILWTILSLGCGFGACYWMVGLIPETPENILTAIKLIKRADEDEQIKPLEYLSTIIESGVLFRRTHALHAYNLLCQAKETKAHAEKVEELRTCSNEIMEMIKK